MKTFTQFLKKAEAPPAMVPVVEETPVSKQIQPSEDVMKLGGPCYPPTERKK